MELHKIPHIKIINLVSSTSLIMLSEILSKQDLLSFFCGFIFIPLFFVLMVYLIYLNNCFQCAWVEPSPTFDGSLIAFLLSSLECLTRYNIIPTPDLYSFHCYGLINGSPGCGLVIVVIVNAGVLCSLTFCNKCPNAWSKFLNNSA